jgi:CheY-like chemotaxis protein
MSPGTALIVEDNPSLRSVLALLLEGDGWSVLEARDGREGLAMAQRIHPDIIITDLRLPGLTGVSLARALGNGDGEAVPLVGITSDPVGAEAARRTGLFREVLDKPFGPGPFLQAVRRWATKPPPDPSGDGR